MEQGERRKRCHPKSDYPILTSDAFLNQNPITKPAMDNRRLLIADVIGKNRLNFKKVLDLDGSTYEPAVRSGDTGQRISCFDSCQLITTLMCN